LVFFNLTSTYSTTPKINVLETHKLANKKRYTTKMGGKEMLPHFPPNPN
jgi:hypothetical protein